MNTPQHHRPQQAASASATRRSDHARLDLTRLPRLLTPATAAALSFAMLSAAALAQSAGTTAPPTRDQATPSSAAEAETQAAEASPLPPGATTDTERVIRYDELNRAMESAASAVVTPIKESALGERFSELIELAGRDSVDKAELATTLTGLRDELDTFADSLDQAPIWEAQSLIGETVERVRTYVTRGPSGASSAELDAQIAELDKQLARLARMIDAEPDPERVRRLKALFGHQIRMKRLNEAAADVDTNDPSNAVWLDIAGSLERISMQLTTTAFTVEEARLAVRGVSERLSLHINTLDALAGREKVAEAISAVGSTSSELADAMGELVSVARQANELDRALQGLTARLVRDVELDAAELPTQRDLGGVVESDFDLDAEIRKYLDRERAAQGRADAVGGAGTAEPASPHGRPASPPPVAPDEGVTADDELDRAIRDAAARR